MLIEIHMIQNHSPSNLNRDDLGAPKTCMFGGVTRARISSQCLKRTIRNPGNPDNIHNREPGLFAQEMKRYIGTRTKLFPWLVQEQLGRQTELGITDPIPDNERPSVVAACSAIGAKGDKAEQKEQEGKVDTRPKTAQLIFLTPRHAAEFVKNLAELRCKGAMKGAYEYFLDPRVTFRSLLDVELGKTQIDEENRAKASKNAWLIAMYNHRMTELLRNRDGAPDPMPAFGPNGEPGQAYAEVIAIGLEKLYLSDEKEDKALFEDLTKGRAQKNKKWRGHEERSPVDGREKPRNYGEFEETLRKAGGEMAVDIALFGRMTTSESFEDVEAAMQVAHAISTHAVVNEVDYFTAVDDRGQGGAAAHVGESMFASPCFYKYFSLDWAQLVYNLAGSKPDQEKDPEGHRKWTDKVEPKAKALAACALGHFLRAAALMTPSGKQNSSAANNEPCGILVEVKETKTTTNYANAFAEPVERIGKPDDDAPDEKSIEGRSVACLADHVYAVRKAYGIESKLFWYSPKLWRFPFQYWRRSEDGKKTHAELVTTQRFDVLGGADGQPPGLVEAVIEALEVKIGGDNLTWANVKDAGKKEA